MKVDALGRVLVVLKENEEWKVMEHGSESKHRVVRDIVIPASTKEDEIVDYLSDLLFGYATERHSTVKVIQYVRPTRPR